MARKSIAILGMLIGMHLFSDLSLADTFVYTAQTRSVSAKVGYAGGSGGPLVISAPGFGDFDKTSALQIGDPYPGSVSQHQHSILSPDSISITGDFSGSRPGAAGTGYVLASSTTDVTFTLAQPADMFFSAHVVHSGTNSVYDKVFAPNMVLKETGASSANSILYWQIPSTDSSGNIFDQSTGLSLPAGSYNLRVYFDTELWSPQQQSSQTTSFSVMLAVPEPSLLAILAFTPVVLMRRRTVGACTFKH